MKKMFFGGTVLTMDTDDTQEAVVFENDKIVFVGCEREAKEKYPDAELINLNGKTLVPGFIDSHCHMSFSGEMMTQPSLFEASSIAEIVAGLRQEADKASKDEVLFINGYGGHPIAENRPITLEEMDKAVPDHPVFLRTAGTHGTFVNTKALKLIIEEAKNAGIAISEEDKAEGFLRNEANLFAYSLPPKLMSEEQKKKAREKMIHECISNGITAVHTMEGRSPVNDPDVLALLRDKDEIPFHLRIYYQTTNVEEVVRLGLKQIGGCFSCILDGDVEPGTAAFREPYIDNPKNYGNLYFTQERLENFFREAHKAGLQICMHAIGDAAIEQALKAYKKVLTEFPRENHRHRVEHFEVSAYDLMDFAKDLKVTLAMQPIFDYYWPSDTYVPHIGPERAAMRCALRPVLDRGIIVGGGSDSPVTSMNPLLGIHAAVNLSVPASRISVKEALRMVTIDAAYLGFEEDERGSIKAGKEANFVILSDNPLEHPKDKLDKIQILETVYRGKTVWVNK
ncbi:amidohydrolase [Treponema socranskii]|uniref:amidohydrolase n=1 Tax=Treponema socranskii TaxID=53419 RepID=UPI00287186A6|nr:amidohydrolase [Treponema socranskii]MDR9860109.1 amidohydrolase [Treponema socranskii]